MVFAIVFPFLRRIVGIGNLSQIARRIVAERSRASAWAGDRAHSSVCVIKGRLKSHWIGDRCKFTGSIVNIRICVPNTIDHRL